MQGNDVRASIDLGEDDDAFVLRRATEERRKIAETSCIVRSVHEELLETYEERASVAARQAAAIEALLVSIDRLDPA